MAAHLKASILQEGRSDNERLFQVLRVQGVTRPSYQLTFPKEATQKRQTIWPLNCRKCQTNWTIWSLNLWSTQDNVREWAFKYRPVTEGESCEWITIDQHKIFIKKLRWVPTQFTLYWKVRSGNTDSGWMTSLIKCKIKTIRDVYKRMKREDNLKR